MPGKVSTYNVETLQGKPTHSSHDHHQRCCVCLGQSVMRSLQHTSEAITNEIGQRMLETLARGKLNKKKLKMFEIFLKNFKKKNKCLIAR